VVDSQWAEQSESSELRANAMTYPRFSRAITLIIVFTSIALIGCDSPPKAKATPKEKARSIVNSSAAASAGKWLGTWEPTSNSFFGASTTIVFSAPEPGTIKGVLLTTSFSDDTVHYFELSDISSDGKRIEFTIYKPDPARSIVVGDVWDQVFGRVFQSLGDYPKKTIRLVMSGTKTATERFLINGEWHTYDKDAILWERK